MFIETLICLILGCALLIWRTNKTNNNGATKSESFAEFRKFQATYIYVYLLATTADWLQGPHVYALYEKYGFSTKQINQLFVAGFGSSMVFGTCIGSLADKYGRKLNCLLYAVFYGIACITKHFPNFWILTGGRLVAGIATSILFSAFESWAICEHAKRGLSAHSLGTLFANSVFGNSVVAVLAGIIAQFAANSFGLVAPFDVSLITLCIMAIVATWLWDENYGNKENDLSISFKEAMVILRDDKKVLCLGLVQSLFEGAMYTFVLKWTPAITPDDDTHEIPHGLVFSAFMVSVMIGSEFFKMLSNKGYVESFMRGVFFVSTLCLAAPVYSKKGHSVNYYSFIVFECCVGIFWPAMATMRGKYVEEKTRATIMNIFRIPLNFIVILVLLQDLSLEATFVVCVTFLALCCVCQQYLYRLCIASEVVDEGRSQEENV